MKISVLGSGSKGNSIFCEAGNSKFLIDIGFSYKQVCSRLSAIGESPEDIEFILISHEHGDHIKGLETFLKNHPIEFYTSFGTRKYLYSKISNASKGNVMGRGKVLKCGTASIRSVDLKHDSAGNIGFYIKDADAAALFIYDTGDIPEMILKKIKKVDVLVIEANHDIDLLFGSKYPWNLKRRILGEKGHLSNEQGFEFFAELIEAGAGIRYVVPFHLSEENNSPEKVMKVYTEGFLCKNSVELIMTFQDQPSKVIEL